MLQSNLMDEKLTKVRIMFFFKKFLHLKSLFLVLPNTSYFKYSSSNLLTFDIIARVKIFQIKSWFTFGNNKDLKFNLIFIDHYTAAVRKIRF